MTKKELEEQKRLLRNKNRRDKYYADKMARSKSMRWKSK